MADLFHDKNISPMLLNEVKEPFDDKDYIYELKLDGIRCIAYLGKDVVLQNKRFKDVSAIYPELSDMSRCVKKNTVLDGELVVLTDGKPDFMRCKSVPSWVINSGYSLRRRRILCSSRLTIYSIMTEKI